ncbi:MAG: metallophosphoesterase [Armatimonadota bacterium]
MRFAVIGDYGLAGQPEADVAALVKSWNPDFIVTTGDNNYPGGQAITIDANIGQYYSEYIYPYHGQYAPPPVQENRFFPSIGNHDWNRTAGYRPYLDYFTLPNNERYYDVVRGPVHLFVLNSDPREPDGIESDSLQTAWFKERLEASTATWKVVVLHHPPYCSDGSTLSARWPYHDWGATAVFAGHEHVYERLVRHGYLYLVNGVGGGELYPMNAPITGSVFQYDQDYGAQLITAGSQSLTFEFFNRAGELIDSYTLATPAPPTPLDLAATTVSDSKIRLTWSDTSATESGFKIERSTDGVSFEQVKTTEADVTLYTNTELTGGATYTYRVRAFNDAGNSRYSNTVSATTEDTPTFTLSGSVRENGAGLSGVTVRAETESGVPAGGTHTATTGTDGAYRLEGLPAGTYAVEAEKGGYSFQPSSQSVTLGPSQTDINFVGTAQLTLLELRLQKTTTRPNKRVKAVVVFSQPLPQAARVKLASSDGRLAKVPGELKVKRGKTEAPFVIQAGRSKRARRGGVVTITATDGKVVRTADLTISP